MSEVILDIDPSANVVIKGIYEGRAFEYVFKNWTDKEKTTAQDFEGTFSMNIFSDAALTKLLYTYTEGAGLIKSGNTLTVKRSDSENKLKANTYYYQIICKLDATHSYPAFKGTIPVNPS